MVNKIKVKDHDVITRYFPGDIVKITRHEFQSSTTEYYMVVLFPVN